MVGKSMISEACTIMGRRLAGELDAAIRAAISARIGRDDWTVEELKGRLDRIVFAGRSQSDAYLMDGKLLLKVWPIDYAVNGNTCTASRNIAKAH